MISLSDLRTALTSEQVEKTALSILETLGFPVASWQRGSVIRTIVSLIGAVVAPFTDFQVTIVASGFLDWASGDWLTVVAEQVYGVTREPATFATGQVQIDNSAGGDFPTAAGEARFYNPATGKVYRNASAFHLAPLQTGLLVDVEAVEEGSASTSSPNTVTAMETPWIGVTVTNPAAIVGFDAESDTLLRLRCRLKLGSLSPNGPASAAEYVARTSTLNGGVTVTRAKAYPDSSLGTSTLYVAGPSGPLSAPDVALIQDAVDKLATPTGYDWIVLSAVSLTMPVTSTVYVYSAQNLVSADVQAAVAAHLTEWVPTLDIGGDYVTPGAGFVFANTLESEIRQSRTAAAQATDPPQIFRVVLTSPAGDFAVDDDEVVVLGTVTTTVVQVGA